LSAQAIGEQLSNGIRYALFILPPVSQALNVLQNWDTADAGAKVFGLIAPNLYALTLFAAYVVISKKKLF
jgi:hypothetical protein